MSIKIKNDNRKSILKELGFAQNRALNAVGMQAVTDIVSKSDFPVDTGLLRNSITFSVSEEASVVYIGTNVEYAKYVEYGTSKMKGRDFMFAPLRANFGHYKEILTNYIKEE